jgi:S1-C subfamily serine protease
MVPVSITRKWLVSLVIVATIFGLLGGGVALTVTAQQDAVQIETDALFAGVYDRVSPSVVSISVVARGEGTGFVIDSAGYIITNNHVVEGATEIDVSFFDGTLAHANIVGLDPDSDLAVVQVDLPEDDLARFQPVQFDDSDTLEIGQTVLAIGSPFGQRWTLTSGIVSAVGRTIQGLTNFSIGGVIQTDAAINPGNSGGPLLDLNGRVVGVNSQIISGSNSSSGVGFAIPGNLAQRVAHKLIEDGYVDYSYLGITGSDVSLQVIDAFDLPNNTRGVFVHEVTAGGPAARAGLKSAVYESEDQTEPPTSADIITAIDGDPVTGISDLITYLAAKTEPGQTVTASVLRNGQEQLELDVRLTPRP